MASQTICKHTNFFTEFARLTSRKGLCKISQ